MPDVDPKAIAKKVFFASFVNSGQVCMAIKRIYAHESIYDALCNALVDEAKQAKVGNGLDPATTLGHCRTGCSTTRSSDFSKTSGRAARAF